MESNKELEEIIENFESERDSYRIFTNKGDVNKHTLLEFQGRFVDLKSRIRPFKKYLTKQWTRRDDKAATAIKFRIAIAISKGEYKDDEGNLLYEKCSITSAEKYASGSLQYKDFVDQRAFYKECLTNVSDLREDLNSYINEIKDRLK
jgi:hypothetical protein